MKKISCLLFLFTGITNADAQQREVIELLPGVTTMEAMEGQIYMYPKFSDAVVSFKNGKNGKGKLNYCYVSDEMLFLTAKGDTLALTGESDIRLITIGNDSFYHDGTAFLKQSKNYGTLITATLKTIKESSRKQIGGYGETVNGVARSLTATTIAKRFVDLKPGDVITLSREIHYFIGNDSKGFLPLNRENVYSILDSQEQKEMNKYIRKTRVNFENLTDVENALAAITTIPKI